MRITVVYSPAPRQVDLTEVDMAEGSRLIDAVRSSGLLDRFPALGAPGQRFGVWGASRKPDSLLRPGDRVEAYRPLQVDPMESRRLRQRQAALRKV